MKTLPARLNTVKPNRMAVYNPDSWRAGKTTAQRGYCSRWQTARVKFLAIYPLCAYCSQDGLVSLATVVDHVQPHKGDKRLFWDESNWQPLCKPCHDIRKKAEEKT